MPPAPKQASTLSSTVNAVAFRQAVICGGRTLNNVENNVPGRPTDCSVQFRGDHVLITRDISRNKDSGPTFSQTSFVPMANVAWISFLAE